MAFQIPVGQQLRNEAHARYLAGDLAPAEQLCRRLLQESPDDVDAVSILAGIAQATARPAEAVERFQHAVRLAPENPMVANGLGESLLSLGREAEALHWFGRALKLRPQYHRAHNNVGRVLHARGDLPGAKSSFAEAVRLNPGYATAHNNLGAVFQAEGKQAEAAVEFRHALDVQPDYPEAHVNLGVALHALGDAKTAISQCQLALRLRPNYARAWAMLGIALQDEARLADALAAYDQALRLHPDFAEIHRRRGEVLEDLGRLPQALASFQTAAGRDHSGVEAHHGAGRLLRAMGRDSEAKQQWERSLVACVDDAARFRAVLRTPAIFQSIEDMRIQRCRLEEGLAVLEQRKLSIADPLAQVNATNFFAAYHGLNDRPIQTRIASLYRRATPSLTYTAPHCREPIAGAVGRPLRVGFVSAFFYMHTIGEVNLGFIRNLSRDVCRVILFPLPGPDDEVGRFIRQSADEVVPLRPSLEQARQQIAAQRLDVLVFTDIGMDPFTYYLAFSRLAAVQCVTWGHPVTTGISTLDYYLSGIDLEPPGADEHYSEKLVRLPGLPTYYHAPAFFPPAKPRSCFGLDGQDHLYLCSQAPFKIHPDYDALLGEILRADPRGRILFIRGQNAEWTHQLRRRLRSSLPREFDRIHFLPHQGGQDYLHLLAACDVLLDSTHFGGGNTHLKAFSVATPIATLPGPFARSRVATACYRSMGITDCIASDRADYVRIAVRLATDTDWRRHIRGRLLDRRHVLFENASILRALEQFFVEAVAGGAFERRVGSEDRSGMV